MLDEKMPSVRGHHHICSMEGCMVRYLWAIHLFYSAQEGEERLVEIDLKSDCCRRRFFPAHATCLVLFEDMRRSLSLIGESQRTKANISQDPRTYQYTV